MLIALFLFGNGRDWTAEIANLAFAKEPYQTRNEIRNFVLSVIRQPCAQQQYSCALSHPRTG